MTTIPEAFALGLQHHQAGELVQAEQLYRQILEVDPNHADALHLLGEIAYRYGHHDIALEYISRAIQLNPWAAPFHCNVGVVYQALGRHAEAIASFQQALQLQPDFAEVHNNLGVSLKEHGRLDEAIAHYRRALQLMPGYAAAHNNLGTALADQGKLDEAMASYCQALSVWPGFADAHNNLGNALHAQKRLDLALASFQEALRLRPDDATTYVNMGVTLAAQGRLDEAIACYRRALSLRPNFAAAHNNLGAALSDQGKPREAMASLENALRLAPNSAEAHVNLGKAQNQQRQFDDAMAHYQEALRAKPDFAEAYRGMGDSLADQGMLDESRASYEQALRLKPGTRLRITVDTMLPLVYQSMSHLQAERQRFTDNLHRLNEEGVILDLTDETSPSPFFLAYQGLNDRDLRLALARLHAAPQDDKAGGWPGSSDGKIKVGFISAFFKNHTIGRLMQGLIANLSRRKFSVTVLSSASQQDEIAKSIRAHADCFLTVPANLPAARRLIAEQKLDVLLYTDIGMDPLISTLAFSRLARIQCVTWGHPETTGLKSIDYFLSSGLFETEDAREHYSETLVRLKTLPAYSYRPKARPPLKGRGDFGFADDCHLYSCLQSVFKLHPEFDDLLGGILRRDPKGVLVLSQGFYPHWNELLMTRFAVSLPDVLDRIRFVAWLCYDDFLDLNAAADVLLDPLYFGGGRTSYEALGLGLPIVTWPSPFLRGRMTLAMYKKMHILDCVAGSAEDYVDIAVKLGSDPEYRADISAKISAASEVLFEDQEAVLELERFFAEAVARIA